MTPATRDLIERLKARVRIGLAAGHELPAAMTNEQLSTLLAEIDRLEAALREIVALCNDECWLAEHGIARTALGEDA